VRASLGEAVRLPTALAAFLKDRGLSYTRRAASALDAAGIAMTLATQAARTYGEDACTPSAILREVCR